MNTPKANDVYAREVVMARVGHLIRRKQQEVERIARILRACFDPDQVQASGRGRIRRIILIGPYARKNWYEDDDTINFSDYEFWIVVNHPLFKEPECWTRARDVIDSELGNRCAVEVRHPHREGRARHLHPRSDRGGHLPLSRLARCAAE